MQQKWLLLLLLGTLTVHPSNSQTVNDILNRYELASGFNARQKVKTITSIGKTTQMGNTVAISIIQKRPNKYRFDVHLNEGRVTQAYDGTSGWTFNPFISSDTIKLEGSGLSQIKESADFDGILHSFRQRGFSAKLIGKVMIGTENTYKVQITKPNGETMNFYLDTDTYLVIKTSIDLFINGLPYASESFFGDFRKVGGMTLPYFIQSKNGAMISETRIDTVRLNELMEDYYFQCKHAK